MKQTVKINGAPAGSWVRDVFREETVNNLVRGHGLDPSNSEISVSININVEKKRPVFVPGDIYQVNFGNYGGPKWYNYVRLSNGRWSGDLADSDMYRYLDAGNARKCRVVPE